MNNSQIILRNNLAIDELKRGNFLNAFELLSQATTIISALDHSHGGPEDGDVVYRFNWDDCSEVLTSKRLPESLLINEGTMSSLCFKFLRITMTSGEVDVLNSLCPCGFGWAVWYNYGIICTAFGVFIGEGGGRIFLERGFDLLESVRYRVEAEETISGHWWKLRLAVLNNQACIYHECSMLEEVSMYLDKIRQELRSASSSDMDYQEWASYQMNLQMLSRDKGAGAA